MIELEDLINNINICNEKIKEALKRANRTDSVNIIGATKTNPKELIAMIQNNKLLTDVGENRVQEIMEKYSTGDKLNWHMIGQLQTNKVKYIIDKVVMIHSLDRESLAQEIDKQAKKRNIVVDCLIEVNMGSEISKGGIDKNDLDSFMQLLDSYQNIRVRGLMSVMPNIEDKELLKNMYITFNSMYKKLQKTADKRHQIDCLSCGMTNDYEMAIEYGGSTMIRLGRVLFGDRQ